MSAALLDGWRPSGRLGDDLKVSFKSLDITIYPSTDQKNYSTNGYYKESALEALEEQVRKSGMNRAELENTVYEEAAFDWACEERRRDRWQELKQLPQLFIAV